MRNLAAVLLSIVIGSPALAASTLSSGRPSPVAPYLRTPQDQGPKAIDRGPTIRREIVELRDEGLKLQESDGGKLTPEHRAYLQAKLDVLLAELHDNPRSP